MLNNKKTKFLIQILIILTIVFLLIKVMPAIKPVLKVFGLFLSPIIIGGFLYYVLRPMKKLLTRFIKNSGIASFVSILLVFAVISMITIYGGEVVSNQFEDAFTKNKNKILDYKDYANEKVQEISPKLNLSSKISNNLNNLLSNVSSYTINIFSSIGNVGTQVVLVPFILFYLLKEDKHFKDKLISVIPSKYRNETKDLLIEIDSILSTYINGQLLVALVIGVLMFVGYLIIGMPNALLMGIFSLITSVIPFIGPFLGILPAILVAMTISFSLVVKIAITALVVQQLEGNLITPNIMGNKLNLHPLAVIFIVIISINFFGILGAFIGTPLYLSLVEISKHAYRIINNQKN